MGDCFIRICKDAACWHFLVVCVSDAEFRNTGLERSEALKNDLEWFRQQGHTIPKPSAPGTTYASLLEDLSEEDPQAFICHFYNVYFAHTAGGRMIGKKVTLPPSEKMTKYWVVHGIMSQHCFGKHNLHSIGTFRCLMPSNPQACICILYWIRFLVPFFFVDTTVHFWLGIWLPFVADLGSSEVWNYLFLHYLVSFNTVPCAPGILGFREDSEQQRAGVLQVGGQSLPAAAERPQQA